MAIPMVWKDFSALMKDQDPLMICTALIAGAVIIVLPFCLICRRKSERRSPVKSTSSINVGSKYNEWREPVFEIGYGEGSIRKYFAQTGLHVYKNDWQDSCSIMHKVVTVIAREMKKSAKIYFPGLVLDHTFIKQGSSREGLKVCDPLEFDYILPFRIEGLTTKQEDVFDCYGNVLPGLFKEKIINDYNAPSWMRKYGLIEDAHCGIYINTSNFQKKVFTSLLDKSREEINRQLQRMTTSTEKYRILRSVNAPNMRITIEVISKTGLKGLNKIVLESTQGSGLTELEADLVPAICLSCDTVPDPYTVHEFHQCLKYNPTFSQIRQIPCERYGVMKWFSESNRMISEYDRDFLWRNSTCGYEKHILDVARRNQSQRYVMTACRLLKGALHQFISNSRGSSQLNSVVKSYHLKNICFYCILFLTVPSKENKLSGVKEALGYFIKYLELSIDAEFLPHFFYGNPYIELMFPGRSFEKETYNLFSFKHPETLLQARLDLPTFLDTLTDLYHEEWMLDPDKVKLYKDLLERRDSL